MSRRLAGGQPCTCHCAMGRRHNSSTPEMCVGAGSQPGERGASRAVDLRPTRDAPVPQRGVRRGPASRLGRGLVAFGRGPRRRRRGRRRAQRRRGHGARAGGSRSRGRPPRGSVAFAARRPDPDRATMAVKDESTPPPALRPGRRSARDDARSFSSDARGRTRSTPSPRAEVTRARTRDAFNARASLCFDSSVVPKASHCGTQQSRVGKR